MRAGRRVGGRLRVRGLTRRVPVGVVLCATAAGAAWGADVRPWLLDGQKQYADGRYEQALKLYRQAADAAGADAAIDYNLGLCHLQLGDGDKALQQFEGVASRAEVKASIRRDAFYNIGVVRANSARHRLDGLLTPATQPSEKNPPPDAPENIPELEAIAAEFLRAIEAFRQSAQVEGSPDAEHNIRAARILRRNTLGLLHAAIETKARQDMLDDPRGYLDSLVVEQARQTGITRLLSMRPTTQPTEARQARRAAIRLQRQTMEQTGVFADHLGRYRETQDSPATAPAGSRPATEPPRERLYHAASRQLKPPATDAMRDACAFFLDGRMDQAYRQQRQAVQAMREAAALFPMDPVRTLARAKTQQAELRGLVEGIANDQDWLRDPLLAEAPIPADARWNPADTALHDAQDQIGRDLERLKRQCRAIATASRPAGEESSPGRPGDPAVDPELLEKLVVLLDKAVAPQAECLDAIAARNKALTLSRQQQVAGIIDEALSLFPKSIEQRIAELIVRQAALNDEVRAAAGDSEAGTGDAAGALLGKVRELTAKLKAIVLRTKPAEIAERFANRQRAIEKDTVAVADEVKKNIPTSTSQPGAAPTTQGSAQETQAYIAAGKHLEKADFEMLAAAEGLEKAVVGNTLKPLQAAGPVQPSQATALEELRKALESLQPPEQRQQQQDRKKDDQQKQEPQQKPKQDVRRSVDQMDREREEAMRQLYKVPPRQVIKDW